MNAPNDRDQPAARRGWRRFAGRSPRTRSVLLATGLLALCISPFAVARTGETLREGVLNGTAKRETQIVANVKATSARTGGYSTRQSNLSNTGGGAVYGCRANSSSRSEPCLRVNNLRSGRAFEFNSEDGSIVGRITSGKGGDTKKPFVTNATGVADGLNADRVDGKSASELQALFARVGAGGAAEATRGVPAGGVTNPGGAGTYNVVFSGALTACALNATLVGTAPGQVTATPAVAGNITTVDVRTFNNVGVPDDRAFNLTANC
jgi:hypothetical protein